LQEFRRQETGDRRRELQEFRSYRMALLVPDKPPVRIGNRAEKLECTKITDAVASSASLEEQAGTACLL
jgi:hypothetical protein